MSLEVAIQENTAALNALLAYFKNTSASFVPECSPVVAETPTTKPKTVKPKAEPAPVAVVEPEPVAEEPAATEESVSLVDVPQATLEEAQAVVVKMAATTVMKEKAMECLQRFGATRLTKRAEGDRPVDPKFYGLFVQLCNHVLNGGTTSDDTAETILAMRLEA